MAFKAEGLLWDGCTNLSVSVANIAKETSGGTGTQFLAQRLLDAFLEELPRLLMKWEIHYELN